MNLHDLAGPITRRKYEVPTTRSTLVGISGINPAGKSFLNNCLSEDLSGPNIQVINVDGC